MKDITPADELQEKLIGSIVDWVQTVFGYTDSEIGTKVYHAARGPQKGAREDLPILLYFFSMKDFPLGQSEFIPAQGGYKVTGGRMATLSFLGYGEGSHEMLTRLGFGAHPKFYPDDITIENLSPLMDLSELDENVIEARCSKDFTVTYRVTTDEVIIPQEWAESVYDPFTDEQVYP